MLERFPFITYILEKKTIINNRAHFACTIPITIYFGNGLCMDSTSSSTIVNKVFLSTFSACATLLA